MEADKPSPEAELNETRIREMEEKFDEFKIEVIDEINVILREQCIKKDITNEDEIDDELYFGFAKIRKNVIDNVVRKQNNLNGEDEIPNELLEEYEEELSRYAAYHYGGSTPNYKTCKGFDVSDDLITNAYKEELEKLQQENQE